jgi:trk system potassium uptake protein TrkA
MKTVAIIGLGKFGFYIAKSLSKLEDFTVIAVDNNEHTIQNISEYVENAFILDSTNKNALQEVGIANLDTVIVSIGEHIEASILTVMALKDLGNKNIIAKAITTTHGEILAKLGASRVVHPEKIAGRALVHNLVENINFEKIDLSNSMRIIKFITPKNLIGKTFGEINATNNSATIVAFKTNSEWHKTIDMEYKIQELDILAYLGESKSIESFYKDILAI